MKNLFLNVGPRSRQSFGKLRASARANRRGFTLLLAALVASIALSLGSSIYDIVLRELSLSSIGQNSEYAFYAADSAAECALYWDARTDVHPNTFATSSLSQGTASSVTCDNIIAPLTIQSGATPTAATTTFEIANLFEVGGAGGYCADVLVQKSENANVITTDVIANGYNVPCSTINTAPNVLQRTVELQY